MSAAERRLTWLVIGLGLGCVLAFTSRVALLTLRVPLDYNEGWNAFHTLTAMAGRELYSGSDEFVVNNYPPLSFYVVGTLGWLTGDHIVAGRLVSLVSFGVLCFGIAVVLRRMACGMLEACFGAAVFAATLQLFSHYVGIDDPQLLGHAVGVFALAFVLRQPASRWTTFTAALFFCLAVFIKHNLVAAPLAVVLWLALEQPGRAVHLTGFGLALALTLLGVCHFLCGAGMLSHLLAPRGYVVAEAFEALLLWSANRCVLIAVALIGLARARHDPSVRLVAWYGAIALVLGTFFSGGDGTDRNVLFDADIALGMAAGLSLQHMGKWRVTAAAFGVAHCAVAIWVVTQGVWWSSEWWLERGKRVEVLAARELQFLRAAEGPALCTTLAFCYWAHQPGYIDTFNLGQRYRFHPEEGAALLHMIEERRFAVMQLDSLEVVSTLPTLRGLIEQNYELDHSSPFGSFLVRRSRP